MVIGVHKSHQWSIFHHKGGMISIHNRMLFHLFHHTFISQLEIKNLGLNIFLIFLILGTLNFDFPIENYFF